MIIGQRIRLRPVERDDLPRYVKWLSDPELRGYLSAHLPISQAQEERWFETNLNAGDTQAFAIDAQPADAGSGRGSDIGGGSFVQIDWRSRHAELASSLAPMIIGAAAMAPTPSARWWAGVSTRSTSTASICASIPPTSAPSAATRRWVSSTKGCASITFMLGHIGIHCTWGCCAATGCLPPPLKSRFEITPIGNYDPPS